MSSLTPSASASNVVVDTVYCQAPVCFSLEQLAAQGITGDALAKVLELYYVSYQGYLVVTSGGEYSPVRVVPPPKTRRGKRGSGSSRVSTASGFVGPDRESRAGTDGDCYGELVVGQHRCEAITALGRYPTFRALLAAQASLFAVGNMENSYITRVRERMYHVTDHGVRVRGVLAYLARGEKWPAGSLGHDMMGVAYPINIAGSIGLDDRLGGFGSSSSAESTDLKVFICVVQGFFPTHVLELLRKKVDIQASRVEGGMCALSLRARDLSLARACVEDIAPSCVEDVAGVYMADVPLQGSVGVRSAFARRNGYCYVEMLRETAVTRAVTVGPLPTFAALARLPYSNLDVERMRRDLRLGDTTGHDHVHVADIGAGSTFSGSGGALSVYDVMKFAVWESGDVEWPDGSFAVTQATPGMWDFVVPKNGVAETGSCIFANMRVGAVSATELIQDELRRCGLVEDAVDSDGFRHHVSLALKSQAVLAADDKRQMRMLAVVGDAALTMVLATHKFDAESTPQSFQEARSQVTRNEYLSSVFQRGPLLGMFTCVGPVTAKIGGEALEALFGAVYYHYGIRGVEIVVKWFDMNM